MAPQAVVMGTGRATGARRVTNEEIAEVVGSSDEWIRKRTGIRARYFVEPGQSNASMGKEAALAALAAAGREVGEVDALIFATLSPDVAFPGTGVYLQEALGIAPVPALDVRNQCSGFLYGLSVATGWIRAGMYKTVLLVGSEIHSTGLRLDEEGRDVAVLFGDGAGAAVVEAREAREEEMAGRIVDLALGADGSQAELLICDRPGSRYHPRVTIADIEAGRHYPKMEGRLVFRRAVEILTREVGLALERNGVSADEVVFVPHQSNRRINEMVAGRLGIGEERVVHTIEDYGNTTAASIPMALDRAMREGRVSPGDVVVLAAFGSGLTWGTAVLRY